jgi:NAD(P)-dependent dehydrogenase (short-subunit alcohol dehydrogenase family)
MSHGTKATLMGRDTHSYEDEVVLELATEGANIHIHSDCTTKARDVEKLAQTLRTASVTIKVAFYASNRSTAAAVERIFNEVMREFVELDIVVKTMSG